MGMFLRRRRPIARLAVGGAVAGAAYHAGKGRGQQEATTESEPADEAASAPYAPPAPEPDASAELERLTKLHASGSLTDQEFTQAKAQVLAQPTRS
jgi:hypothetical protein